MKTKICVKIKKKLDKINIFEKPVLSKKFNKIRKDLKKIDSGVAKKSKNTYLIDVPEVDGSWETVIEFSNKKDAIAFCKQKWNADKFGRVNLITEIQIK